MPGEGTPYSEPVSESPTREGLLPPTPVRWGLPDVALGLAITAGIIAANVVLSTASWLPVSDAVGVIVAALFYGIVAAFLVAVVRRRGTGSLVRDFGLRIRWVDLAIGLGLAVALKIGDLEVYRFAVGVLGLPNAPTSNASLPHSLVWALIYGIGIATLGAPLVEELFFRGLVLRAVRNFVIQRGKDGELTTRRATTASVLLSAAVFATAHLYEARNLTMLFVLGVSIFLFGLVTGAIATRTGRLGPSLVTHAITNGFAVVLILTAQPY